MVADEEQYNATSNFRTAMATRFATAHPLHHGILRVSEQVVDEVGAEDAECAVCRRAVGFSSDQYRFQVLGRKDSEKSEQIEKEQNVCRTQENGHQDSDPVRCTIVGKGAADEGEGREQNGETLRGVEAIKLLAVGTARCLNVQCHYQEKRSHHGLDVGPEFVREHDHDGEHGLLEHDHRFPEYVFLAVGPIDETSDVVDPAILVVFCDLQDDELCGRQREPEGEDDEERPSQESGQNHVRSIKASDIGIQNPVVCLMIDSDQCGIMNFDAVEDVDVCLADGDVADVADDEGTQDTLLQEIHPRLVPSDLDHQPENGEDEDALERLQGIHQNTGDGALRGHS